MAQVLCTPGANSHFNFLETLIHLKRLQAQDIPRIMNWYGNRQVFVDGGSDAGDARSDKAELVHEATHFLDATTTLWGLEYNGRKAWLSESLLGGARAKQNRFLSVFMLNAAEIDAHRARVGKAKLGVSLSDCVMTHEVLQDEQFGPMIVVTFGLEDAEVQKVPLTMLSVLEANGYANEVLSLILDAEQLADERERRKTLDHIEHAYKATMQASRFTEYTLILHLANRAFSTMSLKQRLRLVSAFVRLVLDLDTYQMSQMAFSLDATFANRRDGAALMMDISRGSSRPVLLFKAIILLHSVLEVQSSQDKEQSLVALATDPFTALEDALIKIGCLERQMTKDVELQLSLDALQEDRGLLDHLIIPQSVKMNLPVVGRRTPAESFFEISTVDPIMDVRTCLRLPKRIDLNVSRLSPDVRARLDRLGRRYVAARPAKFFLRF